MTEVLFISENGLEREIKVEAGQKTGMVLIVLPGTSCDIRLDVTLAGEGAEADIYGAYVCGADERVKIAVDMHHEVPHCNSRQLFNRSAGQAPEKSFFASPASHPNSQ